MYRCVLCLARPPHNSSYLRVCLDGSEAEGKSNNGTHYNNAVVDQSQATSAAVSERAQLMRRLLIT